MLVCFLLDIVCVALLQDYRLPLILHDEKLTWQYVLFLCLQVVVNYSSSSGPAEEVAQIITDSGGQALTIGADISKPAEVDRWKQQQTHLLTDDDASSYTAGPCDTSAAPCSAQ